jgi:hypothetical protein
MIDGLFGAAPFVESKASGFTAAALRPQCVIFPEPNRFKFED